MMLLMLFSAGSEFELDRTEKAKFRAPAVQLWYRGTSGNHTGLIVGGAVLSNDFI